MNERFGEVVTWLAGETLVSRATSSFITHDRRFLAVWQEIVVKFYLPPQLCKISRMASKSARSVFDFLRLTRSWLRIVAASGVNFSKSVAAGAKFCFFSESFASISSRSARSVSSCDHSSTNSCLSKASSVLELLKSVCNPIFRVA